MAPSRSPINSVKLPIAKLSVIHDTRHRGGLQGPGGLTHTDLKPDLLIERGDFLRGVQWRALLTLRLQGNVAVDLGMSRDVGMMRGDGPGG